MEITSKLGTYVFHGFSEHNKGSSLFVFIAPGITQLAATMMDVYTELLPVPRCGVSISIWSRDKKWKALEVTLKAKVRSDLYLKKMII